jgi:NADPH:quinone reductase-like Zn-dependent oxidoreductase
MMAIVQNKYGSPDDVLELKDIDKPVVKDDEVLVRVHTASVHPDVWHLVRGLRYVLRLTGAGFLKPKTVFRERMWQGTLCRLARS